MQGAQQQQQDRQHAPHAPQILMHQRNLRRAPRAQHAALDFSKAVVGVPTREFVTLARMNRPDQTFVSINKSGNDLTRLK